VSATCLSQPVSGLRLAKKAHAGVVTVSELCDDLVRAVQAPHAIAQRRYKDQVTSSAHLEVIHKQFGHRPASTLKASAIKPYLLFRIQFLAKAVLFHPVDKGTAADIEIPGGLRLISL
jgi:hypothetical protein